MIGHARRRSARDAGPTASRGQRVSPPTASSAAVMTRPPPVNARRGPTVTPRFEALTDPMLAGPPHPLQVGIRAGSGMGLHLANDPRAHARAVERRDVPQRTTPWRQG